MYRLGGGNGGGGKKGLVAVAVDKDKGSQHALKWAVENLLSRGQTVVLIHVLPKQSNPVNISPASRMYACIHQISSKLYVYAFMCAL